jgi:hypothetical protein
LAEEGLFGACESAAVSFVSRHTSPGTAFELTLAKALELGGYRVSQQTDIGARPGGTRHIVDFVVSRADRTVLVSAKWQGSSGTGEDKVAWEVMSIAETLESHHTYAKAYVVLGGPGWTQKKRDFFVAGGLKGRIVGADRVECINLDEFLNHTYRGEL